MTSLCDWTCFCVDAARTHDTTRLQLERMGLLELPFDLFVLKHVKTLWLGRNAVCALPREIAQLTKLELIHVRTKCEFVV